jgi:Skp family chaperone for outer membrane proteins
MIYFKKSILILSIIFFSQQSLLADIPHFLDFKYILNESTAGKKAQSFLRNKLDNGIKNLQKKEKDIQSEEKKLIEQKKIIAPEEYKKSVQSLRTKVLSLQKERKSLLETVAKQRNSARKKLLDNLNPIVKNYMEEKKIRIVLDKKSLLLADEKLDITNDILGLLNKKLTSIKLN